MNRFFKLYKFLFEDDKYKDIGLNSKVAYCVYRDLIQAFKRFFNGQSNYPKIKNKKNPKQSFRIQNNKNIKITNLLLQRNQKHILLESQNQLSA